MQTALKKKPVAKTAKSSRNGEIKSFKIQKAVDMAGDAGFLSGPRSVVLRGRMPAELVAQARDRSGIKSDSKLMEAALASLAFTDDYGQFLYEHRGTVDPDLDLEF